MGKGKSKDKRKRGGGKKEKMILPKPCPVEVVPAPDTVLAPWEGGPCQKVSGCLCIDCIGTGS